MKLGIATLLSEHRDWLAGKRVGLVSHAAAVDARGRTSAELLRGVRLACLFGPEHGFDIKAGAGEACRTVRHRSWAIPVYSLYGETRKPTPAMLRNVDTLVFDIQNLAVRCYTYISTLRLVMEAAAEAGKELIVADRPVPLPCVIDGPVTARGFESFVAAVPSPMCYAMTPGEAALWLKDRLRLKLDLRVSEMAWYRRQPHQGHGWPPWVPPSPAIVSWASAMCYPATVFSEAFPGLDHGALTRMPFQVFGYAGMNAAKLRDLLEGCDLPGVTFRAAGYIAAGGPFKGKRIYGIRLEVSSPASFRPILTAVAVVHCLQQLRGKDVLWNDARPAWFDKLFGADSVRLALLDGEEPAAIAAKWDKELRQFDKARGKHLLYSTIPSPSRPT